MASRKLASLLLSTVTLVGYANLASAVPTQVVDFETFQCDVLSIPTNVDEIGDITEFPANEALTHADRGQSPVIPCPSTDNSLLPEVLVEITNQSGIEWREVWYVADPNTSITNFDGEANDIFFPPLQEAFRIDNMISDPNGSHHPLVSETGGLADGRWQPGETWLFVLQDYTNSNGLPPDAITSIGVGDASSTPATGIVDSSGSIIAIAVPERASVSLLAMLGLGGLTRWSRRQP